MYESLCQFGTHRIPFSIGVKRHIWGEVTYTISVPLSSAIGEINTQAMIHHKSRIQWNVHGLKFQDGIKNNIEEKAKPNVVQITALSSANSVDNLTWKNCLAFIVPEIVDETFNHVALSALWLGIPTIVSSQSSIGKFLLELTCPEKSKAVITLTGDPQTDEKAWIEKINNEILSEEATPMKWAKTLSEHLHGNIKLWKFDLLSSEDNLQKQSGSSDDSFLLKLPEQQPVQEKVMKWRVSIPTQDEQNVKARRSSVSFQVINKKLN